MSDPMNQSTDSSLIAASKVDGKAVFDPAGEKLGTIKDIYIDKRSGEVEFAALAFGGVLGMGEKYHPLPWRELDYDPGKDGFVVGIAKRALEESPSFAETDLGGEDPAWGEEVRTYYEGIPGSDRGAAI
ncbi:MAG TPA: PRC-barrel domain-containing protein [Caulobacteraceae bacterium]|jgi:sporulation protein YlmC with PRC-barrel domain|nr:PRC-barrel domain-containing protein [Caulobacteraceae bacterium]